MSALPWVDGASTWLHSLLKFNSTSFLIGGTVPWQNLFCYLFLWSFVCTCQPHHGPAFGWFDLFALWNRCHTSSNTIQCVCEDGCIRMVDSVFFSHWKVPLFSSTNCHFAHFRLLCTSISCLHLRVLCEIRSCFKVWVYLLFSFFVAFFTVVVCIDSIVLKRQLCILCSCLLL